MYSYNDYDLEMSMAKISDELDRLEKLATEDNMVGLSPYFMDAYKALKELDTALSDLNAEIDAQIK